MGIISNLLSQKKKLISVKMSYYNSQEIFIDYDGEKSFLPILVNYYIDKSIYNTQNTNLMDEVIPDLQKVNKDMQADEYKNKKYDFLKCEFKKLDDSMKFEIVAELCKKGNRVFLLTHYKPLSVRPELYVEKSIKHLLTFVMKNISQELQKALVSSLLMQCNLYKKVGHPLSINNIGGAPTAVYREMFSSFQDE